MIFDIIHVASIFLLISFNTRKAVRYDCFTFVLSLPNNDEFFESAFLVVLKTILMWFTLLN